VPGREETEVGGAQQVRRQRVAPARLPLVEVDLVDAVVAEDPGIVDENVYPSQAGDRLIEQTPNAVRLAQVSRQRKMRAPGHGVQRLVRRGLVVQVTDCHPRTAPGESRGDCPADPPRSTGYENASAIEIHVIPPSLMIAIRG
jgi:hypothetical protein